MSIRKFLSTAFAVALAGAAGLSAQTDVTIQQIQQVHPDSLVQGRLASPYVGQKVRFVGVATAATVANRAQNDNRQLLSAGARYVNYIQDTLGAAFGGVNVLIDPKSGALDTAKAKNTGFDRIEAGDVVRITGTVSQFPTTPNGANQVALASDAEVEFLYKRPRPTPIATTIANFYVKNGVDQAPQYTTGARYQGMLVELRDVVVKESRVGTGSSAGRVTLTLVDAQGNEIRVRDQSGYFLARGAAARLEYLGQDALTHIKFVDTTDYYLTGYGTFTPPTVGTTITRIAGVISANTSGGNTIPFMITPVYPTDLEVGAIADQLASIFTVRRDKGFPSPSDAVNVTFVARQGTNAINDGGVQVCYSVGGAAPQCVNASRTNDTTFSATIPAQADGATVSYWVRVPDTKGQAAISPVDTARFKYFYKVFSGAPTIRDVQYTDNLSGTSGFVGFEATVSGVVTADTNDLPGDYGASGGPDPLVAIQSGNAAWSGIAMQAKDADGAIIAGIAGLRRGDSVTVRGLVAESNNMTVLRNAVVVTAHGKGSVPAPVALSTADIGQKRDGQTRDAEQWESMLVRYEDVTVVAELADGTNFGEYLAADVDRKADPSAATRIETDNSRTGYTTRTPGSGEEKVTKDMKFASIAGILAYTFNNYKLIPRGPEDYVKAPSSVGPAPELAVTGVSVMPNPSSTEAVVSLRGHAATTVDVAIADAAGRIVARPATGLRIDGGAQIRVNLAGIAAGAYFIVVTTPGGSLSAPLVVR